MGGYRTSIWLTLGMSYPAVLISSRCLIPLDDELRENCRLGMQSEKKYILVRYTDASDLSSALTLLKRFVRLQTFFLPRHWVVNQEKVNILVGRRLWFAGKEFLQGSLDSFQSALVSMIPADTFSRCHDVFIWRYKRKIYGRVSAPWIEYCIRRYALMNNSPRSRPLFLIANPTWSSLRYACAESTCLPKRRATRST